MRKNNKYTNEFKKKVINEYLTGNESFYFLLNDASISDEENGHTGFLPKDQEALENSSNAYAPIYKKY